MAIITIEEDVKLDFCDVLIKPKRSLLSSRAKVDLTREFTFLHSKQTIGCIPIIASNMDTIGTFSMANVLNPRGLITAIHKHYTIDELIKFFDGRNMAFYTMGTSDADEDKLNNVIKGGGKINFLCVDVANGYTNSFLKFVERKRKALPDVTIMAGNVVTADVTYDLIKAGADIVKIGIGPGSVCTTRKQTGVGYPQLSAIFETADVAHHENAHICADGGCQCPGDIAKAFGAGADFVMIGGMLAGHDECEPRTIYTDQGITIDFNGQTISNHIGKASMKFYGMSSDTAMNKHNGGMAEYRSSEGKSVDVRYKGPVIDTIIDMLGGIRSACTYVGAARLKEMSKRTTFIRVNNGRQLNDKFKD